jgi:EAL domain-containing protein (putative c-di-GMP-specific phosphodiesterase class I)
MYQAKRTRTGGVVVYQSDRDPHDRDRLLLIEEFRDALRSRRFVLHYQPLVSFDDGSVTGVEALVRWPHPTQGLLPPLSFIPLAERAGLLPRLTRIVIEEAVMFAASVGAEHGALSVSVNVSAQDLLDDALPEVVTAALAAHGLDGRRLTLEITEDALVREPERARRLLDPLRALGIRVSVDDFGTGYQSLGQLLALDIDEVKLDRSLVEDVAANPRSQAVVRAMASLTQSLGLHLVAEGIETQAALEQLRELGCTTAQGFLLARPVPGPQLAAELRRLNAERRAAPSGSGSGSARRLAG